MSNISYQSVYGIIAVFFLLLVSACASKQMVREDIQRTWEGRNMNDLIAEFGPPTQTLNDGQGGKIFIYSHTKTIHTGGSSFTDYQGSTQRKGDYYQSSKGYVPGNQYSTTGTAYTYTTPGSSTTRTRNKMFWVKPDGTIYRTEYQSDSLFR